MSNTTAEIEIPSHCPLCHKPLGKHIYQVILADETAICIHCWHLDQEMTIRALRVQPDWWMLVQRWAKWVWDWRCNIKRKTRDERKALEAAIEEINSGETPVVVVATEIEDELCSESSRV